MKFVIPSNTKFHFHQTWVKKLVKVPRICFIFKDEIFYSIFTYEYVTDTHLHCCWWKKKVLKLNFIVLLMLYNNFCSKIFFVSACSSSMQFENLINPYFRAFKTFQRIENRKLIDFCNVVLLNFFFRTHYPCAFSGNINISTFRFSYISTRCLLWLWVKWNVFGTLLVEQSSEIIRRWNSSAYLRVQLSLAF